MMHWGRVGDPILHYLPGLAPDLTQAPNYWKPDIDMLKVHYGEKSPLIKDRSWRPLHYGEKSPLIKDRSWGPWVSRWVLWGPLIPAPVVITSLLWSLYSILTIYCVLLCMSVMHDALGRVGHLIPCYLHGLEPDHWKPDMETLKVHY